jgi:hypothetical protein
MAHVQERGSTCSDGTGRQHLSMMEPGVQPTRPLCGMMEPLLSATPVYSEHLRGEMGTAEGDGGWRRMEDTAQSTPRLHSVCATS